jgi:hypothetical protein
MAGRVASRNSSIATQVATRTIHRLRRDLYLRNLWISYSCEFLPFPIHVVSVCQAV